MNEPTQENLISYIALLEAKLEQANRVLATVHALDPQVFDSPAFHEMAEQERLMYH